MSSEALAACRGYPRWCCFFKWHGKSVAVSAVYVRATALRLPFYRATRPLRRIALSPGLRELQEQLSKPRGAQSKLAGSCSSVTSWRWA